MKRIGLILLVDKNEVRQPGAVPVLAQPSRTAIGRLR